MDPHDPTRARRRFETLAGSAPGELRLDEAALVVAAEDCPGVDVDRWLGHLDALADRVRAEVAAAPDPRGQLAALRAHLFGADGLRGNADDYGDPRNSYLHEVLARRLGIPITLSVVLLAVARRVDVPLQGVGFPLHFLVRHPGPPPILADPFHGGVERDEDACRALLARLGGGRIPFSPALLRPTDPRDILARVLRNLKAAHAALQDWPRAIAASERLLLLAPGEGQERRDCGLLRVRAGRLREGAADLDAYVRAHPDAPDAAAIARARDDARRRLWRLN